MKAWVHRFIFILAAAFTLSEVSVASSLSGNGESNEWAFRVLLDDRPIGYHRVSVNRLENSKTVHTRADFDVRILFIPVYSYEHETRERWENNCLVDIESTTDDNGDAYFISSLDTKERLKIKTQDGVTSLDGCVRTFAYWDVDMLKSDRLLNTQSGEYESVSVSDMGTAVLTIDSAQIEARLFRLVSGTMTIDLWYTEDMHWLALESVTESGAVLRYLPENPAGYVVDARS